MENILARFPNALGYLLELRDQENLQWFSKICDYAISSENGEVSEEQLSDLYSIFLGITNYQTAIISQNPIPQQTQHNQLNTNGIWLEKLSNFQNFKNISNTLDLKTPKRINIIFGMNGAGKSSVCEAIKILSLSQLPEKPIKNVRASDTLPSAFNYKFSSDTSESTWNESSGYGFFSNRIKYFDSILALKYLNEPSTPENIVEISPFRMEVFNYVGDILRKLSSRLEQNITNEEERASEQIIAIKTIFNQYINNYPAIRELDVRSYLGFEEIFNSHSALSEQEQNHKADLETQINRINEATTESGLKLQKNEFDTLLVFSRDIKKIKNYLSSVSLRSSKSTYDSINKLVIYKKELASSILLSNANEDDFIKFIEDSANILDYNNISDETVCPFCRQTLSEDSITLIHKYQKFLLDSVGNKIKENEKDFNSNIKVFDKLRDITINSSAIKSFLILGSEFNDFEKWVVELHNILGKETESLDEKCFEIYENSVHLNWIIKYLAKELLSRYRTLKIATSDTNISRLYKEQLNIQLMVLDVRDRITNNYESLNSLLTILHKINILYEKKDKKYFTYLLRKTTNKSKEAYRELVVSEFSRVLNQEYVNLTNRQISSFGVTLVDSGIDQNVVVNTQIGDQSIIRILSEGEQKIHSLSLFFAELSVSNHDIIIFDDPVNSFDWNYSNNFAERLKDYILQFPLKQIIVLTHNWDFFIYVQQVLKGNNLNDFISIQILEQCAVVNEYTEKIVELKRDITNVLHQARDLSAKEKESLSGDLRRLIERIVNKYVFNEERHQFIQKVIKISVFDNFTKLVPLTGSEALQLKNLYRNLSPSGHDEIRNNYTDIDIATFNRWYVEICAIETSLMSRRP
jgi:recombinational DNA repair ATPase RecF